MHQDDLDQRNKPVIMKGFLPIECLHKLDPADNAFAMNYIIMHNLGITLLGFDNYYQYENRLAKSFDVSEDNNVVDFTIRDSRYSDGSLITIQDVANSFKRMIIHGSVHIQPESIFEGAENLNSLDDDIEGISITGPRSIKFRFKRPVKDIHYYMQMADSVILHPDQYTKLESLTVDDWLVTSGPYTLRRENGVLGLSRSVHYSFDVPNPIPRVEFFSSENTAELITEIRDGRLHMGIIEPRTYGKLFKNIDEFKQLAFSGGEDSVLIHLRINSDSNRLADYQSRRWVQQLFYEKFPVPDKPYFSKAHQYFFPSIRGGLTREESESIIFARSTSFTEEFLEQMKQSEIRLLYSDYYIKYFENEEEFKEYVYSVHKNIKLIKVDSQAEFQKMRRDPNIDVAFSTVSMSVKVPFESLNLAYRSTHPFFADDSGEIAKLIENYQNSRSREEELSITKRVMAKMLEDAEFVPLLYSGFMFFYDKNRIDISQANQSEAFEVWKYREVVPT